MDHPNGRNTGTVSLADEGLKLFYSLVGSQPMQINLRI